MTTWTLILVLSWTQTPPVVVQFHRYPSEAACVKAGALAAESLQPARYACVETPR